MGNEKLDARRYVRDEGLEGGGSQDTWNEWRRYVLEEIKRTYNFYIAIDKKVDKISLDIAMLKVKAGFWGVIGGSIPVIIGLALWILKGMSS